ncbi:hypothetical protein [Streptomyces boluensis]|uniref:Uncharacterized protein n=1 Tax=Streptomyces boluensis TaxID=1775135 RepID=A0A964XKQ9_9ACTN|nr:hypothetical protein [Streptomyces boluensis]NBE51321.1 hypothetical protein [Streptomyces boluensis]
MDADEDFARTASLLGALDLYERRYETDAEFVAVLAPALALSLPPGFLPLMPPRDEDPGERWW